jgi:hypothetical protein
MISEKRFLGEELMAILIQREQARIIRSSQFMYIMSINCSNSANYFQDKIIKKQLVSFFNRIKKVEENIRECDFIGWIKKNETIGIVFIDIQKNANNIIEKRILDIYNVEDDNNFPKLEIKTATYPMKINCEDTFIKENSPLENLKKKKRSMNQE